MSQFIVPTFGQIRDEMRSQGIRDYHREALKFYTHFENCDWRLSGGRGAKMKSWKLAVTTWRLRMGEQLPVKPKAVPQDGDAAKQNHWADFLGLEGISKA